MEKAKNSIKVINLSGGYIVPRISESSKSRKAYVEIGIDGIDDFFTTLIKRYETSPTNQACIDGTTDLIFGKGVKAKDRLDLEEYLYSLTTEDEIRKIVHHCACSNSCQLCSSQPSNNSSINHTHDRIQQRRKQSWKRKSNNFSIPYR